MEKTFRRTRAILEQLKESRAKILICTRSGLVTRDLDLLTTMPDVTVAWSINSLEEKFVRDMEHAATIKRRLAAMQELYQAGVRTVCFISPIFPGITDPVEIIEQVKDRCHYVWLENLNLRGGFKSDILNYIRQTRPGLIPLYRDIYERKNYEYWDEQLLDIESYAQKHGHQLFDNYLPDHRMPPGKLGIINYLYHEQIRGSDNTGKRNKAS
ncbi:radical SAM protein [Trueperella sp. LYQ143]|uniref:radical SAM protein n=1 Tax=unclassified Trueperella TaxID=2630174 RepID=UPI003982F549